MSPKTNPSMSHFVTTSIKFTQSMNTFIEFTVIGTTPSLASRCLVTASIYEARAFLRELRADGYQTECRQMVRVRRSA